MWKLPFYLIMKLFNIKHQSHKNKNVYDIIIILVTYCGDPHMIRHYSLIIVYDWNIWTIIGHAHGLTIIDQSKSKLIPSATVHELLWWWNLFNNKEKMIKDIQCQYWGTYCGIIIITCELWYFHS